jgi:hypothetical protein
MMFLDKDGYGRRIAAAGLFVLLLAAPAATFAATLPASPPDGSYAYAIFQNGAKIGSTSVTVTRSAGAVTSHESETITGGDGALTVDQTLDPASLSPTSYVTTPCRLNAQVAVTARLTFDSNGADETVDGTAGATHFPFESGTSHLYLLDGAFMTGFLFLPAQTKAQSLTSFTGLAACSAVSLAYTVGGSAGDRPQSVPAADAGLAFSTKMNNTPVAFVEWYDPQSMVVDEVDVAAEHVTITRLLGASK